MEIKKYFNIYKEVIDKINLDEIQTLIDCIYTAYENKKTIFLIGNGGSAAKASHVAQDFSKGLIGDPNINHRVKALSLTDNIPYITALGNDEGYENIFSGQLRIFAEEGDYLIAISGSGNSENIIKAAEFAKVHNMKVIGVTGFDGGVLKKMSDVSVNIPIYDMCMVESVHSVIFHYVVTNLRDKISGVKTNDSDYYRK
jgi:D-sedoheptulose 7-phosphate isomerase